MADQQRSFLSRKIFPDGDEPDAQFTLANERTFLAWTRTALAFLAGGIALGAFPVEQFSNEVRTGLSVFVLGVGMFVAASSVIRWIRVERAGRHNRPLPVASAMPVLSAAVVVASAVAIWLFVLA
ncbi:YidH family protein [Corynebacterium alimapuense]|uniref:DUF202 domain-containing protein n=1 Tax=Corynebacterium alimapuense TaxID=1576874 RepID=A0A3M8K8V9_9CORY|nr:DUF202 domain-containing protein [Corynebacterium alimapuense]RNE49667.1 hypothetical protein C5L39_04855 [Corynebacterium alimapuense]